MAKSGQTVTAGATDKVVAINAVHYSSSSDDETIVRNPSVTSQGVSDIPQSHNRFVNYDQNSQVGVNVTLLPFIGQESMELSIVLIASDAANINANGTPIINTRNLSTKVRLKDGEPFVIGGLERKTDIKRSVKVPFLGNIPVLGWLFGQETDTNRKTKVVMVVKPKFILGTASDMEMPQECKTTIALAKGEQKIEIPKTCWGFDQWLLDKEK
jgi:type II secretory pathway component GspD/PulD (secretin)